MRYPLGTDSRELERLYFQHHLWSDAAHALWRRAGIVPGARVLDVGCGPGAATFDLARLVTSRGHVMAIDASADFVEFVREQAQTRGFSQVTTQVCDVQNAIPSTQPGQFDLAYLRWVLCFLLEPENAIRNVAPLLKPGGMICIHDYFNYEVMTPAPRRASYTHMVQTTARSFRDNGGDPDVMGRLPRILADSGFELVHLDVHQRLARPGESMWHWAQTWWESYVPKLVANNYVTEHEAAEFFTDLGRMTHAYDFLVLPPVFEMMAKKL